MGKHDFDPVIHAPQRLRIGAFLAPLEEAEFSSLREALDVRDPVISKHVARLEDEGYVRVLVEEYDQRSRLAFPEAREQVEADPPPVGPARA